MRAHLARMQEDYLLEMEDAVVVTRDAKGKVKLHQSTNLTAAGAVGGTFWGALIGLIFMAPLLGAAVGAGAGAVSGALSDIGIKDDFMRDLGKQLVPGTSALFVLLRNVTVDKVLDGLRPFMGKATVIRTSLDNTQEADLRRVLEGIQSQVSQARAS